jgi:glycosyltransferase involved in cell wall biosynthesis
MAAANTVHLVSFPRHDREVERFLAQTPRPNLKLHWVRVEERLDGWKPEEETRIKLHYLRWLRRVRQYVHALHQIEKFDVVHHVGWGTISVPSPFWRLKIPLIWGPLGGGQVCPSRLLVMFGVQSFPEALRTLRVRSLPLLPSFRASVQKSFAVLATNRETQAVLRKAGVSNVHLLMDSALPRDFIPQPVSRRTAPKTVNLIWANRLVRWKGLDLAILALRQLGEGSGVRLVVAGGGPLQSEFSERVRRLGLERTIVIRGRIPWDDMAREFESADALLLTSTRESLGSVVLEAAAYALPFIALDLGGASTFFPASAGIKIAPTTLKETAADIAKAIVELRDYPEKRLEMGRCAHEFAKASTWDVHAQVMQQFYDDAAASGHAAPE